MRQLIYNDTARDDILAITRYIRITSGNREIARSFAGLLRQQCQKIAALPGMLGRDRSELRQGLRSLAFKNYVILFVYWDESVEIINVIERHRDMAARFDTDEN